MHPSSLGRSMPGTSRRTVLRGLGGATLLGAGVPLLGACAGSSSGSSGTKTVTVGSNASDAVPTPSLPPT